MTVDWTVVVLYDHGLDCSCIVWPWIGL